ncbi:hypothetical protein HUJ05_008718 [Dendroctonus ponderosae]|nr:hypothetical protein HUJ05_008718 [Dendroctonus ponderosae]
MEIRFFGITCKDLRQLVFEIAETRHLKHNFNVEKKWLVKKWVKGFLTRHPRILLRISENVSMAYAQAFNKTNITSYLSALGAAMWMSRKQVSALSTAERGKHLTVYVQSASLGTFFHQFLDFQKSGSRMNQDIELWLTQNPGRTVTDFEIYGLLDNVFSQGATLANSVNAFAKTCIVPFKPNVFEDWMFAPSLTTDQLMSQEGEENEQDLSQDHIAGETGEALKKDSTKEDNAHQNDKIQLPEVVNCELLPWKILKIALKLYPRFPLLLLDHKILGSANEARLD